MQTYYRNAALTLSIGSASGDDEGFLAVKRAVEEPLATLPLSSALQLSSEDGVTSDQLQPSDFLYVRRFKNFQLTQRRWEPLFRRAWTLQEDVLGK
jgi:hypothetical protein